MIEKLEFYHGAALVRVIEDARCESIAKHACGYRVNDSGILAIKYSTKARSPWGFTFSADDIFRLSGVAAKHGDCSIALVCGGDGVCALSWRIVSALLADSPGSITAKREFAGCYAVTGPAGVLKGKVAMNRWPGIVFEGQDNGGGPT
jgi:hypothetical protein